MSQERNVKNSILNYVETFIEKRDQERRESSSDDDDYQRKRGIDRNAVVIKEGDEDYPREKLVNIPDISPVVDSLLLLSRNNEPPHQRISMLMN